MPCNAKQNLGRSKRPYLLTKTIALSLVHLLACLLYWTRVATSQRQITPICSSGESSPQEAVCADIYISIISILYPQEQQI